MCGVICGLCNQKIADCSKVGMPGCHVFAPDKKPANCWDYVMTCAHAVKNLGERETTPNPECESFKREKEKSDF